MTGFGALQTEFAQALRDPALPVPEGIAGRNVARPTKRFAVYRNNVAVGLIDALRIRFPATERIVGANFFVGMAQAFIDMHPPHSPVLLFFGDRLPGFIDGFEPAASVPYLASVARIECERTRSYHASDERISDLFGLLSEAPDVLLGAKLVLHPSLAVVRSRFPAVTIWELNARDEADAQIHVPNFDEPEDALITRPDFDVHVDRLPRGGAILLDTLRTATFGDAVNAAKDEAGFDLTQTLALLIRNGAFCGFQLNGTVSR